MPKETQNTLTLENPVEISKGLAFTKKEFEDLVISSMDLIKSAKKEKLDSKLTSDLYGLFYSSFAGAIRAGTLCSRENGLDGFPELQIIIGNNAFHCREYSIRSIFGAEADEIIKPYEDNFDSYIKDVAFTQNFIEGNADQASFVEEKSIKGKNKKRKEDISEYLKEIEDLKISLKTTAGKYQKDLAISQSKVSALIEEKQILENQLKTIENGGDLIETLKGDMQALQSKYSKLEIESNKQLADFALQKGSYEKEITALKKEQDELNKQCDALNADKEKLIFENESVKKEAASNATSNSKFKEYEKYYETILPQLATALEFTTEGLVVKTFLALSGVCTIIAAFFLLFLV